MIKLLIALILLALPALATELTYDKRGNPFGAFRLGTVILSQFTSTSKTLQGVTDTSVKAILVMCTTDCHFAQNISPATASASDLLLTAETYFTFKASTTDGFAVIRRAADGLIYFVYLK